MRRYKNLSGISGVIAYETGDDSITVKFKGGGIYLYTFQSTGQARVEKMKALAVAGRGLSTFISRYVKESYAAKLR